MDINEFLDKVSDKQKTKNQYKSHIMDYFNFHNLNPNTYFYRKRYWENDIDKYVIYLRKPREYRIGDKRVRASFTNRAKINSIKQFFIIIIL